MLHLEVTKLWSKGVISIYTDSKAKYDDVSNSLIKLGEHLKQDDLILRRVDENGQRSNEMLHSWKVSELVYERGLMVDELTLGDEYGVYIRCEKAIMPFRLVAINLKTSMYMFESLTEGVPDLEVIPQNLPSIYPKGVHIHSNASKIILECVKKGDSGGYMQEELSMYAIKNEKFTLDVGHTHVVEAIG